MQKIKKLILTITALALIFTPFMTAHAETATHTYDELNRLMKSEYSDGTTIIYDYDKIGNRTLNRKYYKPHLLTVQKTGTGAGTITSSPARINCGATCSETFSEDTPITMTAIPDAGSIFIEWSGSGCTESTSCVISLTSDEILAAVFLPVATCTGTGSPVKIGSADYLSLQDAYDHASNGAIIQSLNISLIEDLNANRPITVTFEGGYACDFSTKDGVTTLRGTITTTLGITTIKDFILQY